MGCYFHKARYNNRKTKNEEKKEYSWDKRRKFNSSEYIVQNIVNSQVYKFPGSVNGQQLIIQNCENTSLFVLDHLNSAVIDDCVNCKIVLGAVKGSVFLRDCKNCVCIVTSGQFRARDCRKLDIFLCCPTRPVLEASSSIHFGCYQLFYLGIEEHFTQTNLSPYNNEWSNIHDFTPVEGENNWCLLPDTLSINDYISVPDNEKLNELQFTFQTEKSIVPHTWGPHKIISGQICFVAFFYDACKTTRANEFVNKLKMYNPECLLLLSKERPVTPREAEYLFRTCVFNSVVLESHVIGFQFCGPNCCQMCEKIASDMASPLIYVASSSTISQQQADVFFTTKLNTCSNFITGACCVKDNQNNENETKTMTTQVTDILYTNVS